MSFYIVTGAAGFIGSNLIAALNRKGIKNIIAVDDLSEGDKFLNLVHCDIAHYYDKIEFIKEVCNYQFNDLKIEAIFHEGACSDTTNHDGRFMMENNYQYTVDLFQWAQDQKIPFLYASSAAVYGKGTVFKETKTNESPLNVYGYSKFLFDQYLRNHVMTRNLRAQVVGLRYFNVYGINEQHKGHMASVAFHHFNQFKNQGYVELFGGYDGYKSGEQKRDFVSVEDVVKVNLYFLENQNKSGIYNVGTGQSESFNELACAVVNTIRESREEAPLTLSDMVADGLIRYLDFPEHLKGKYQSFTEADITQLRKVGYQESFYSVKEGVTRYITELMEKNIVTL